MPMQSAMDLYMHELGDIYDAENRIAQMLPQLLKETQDTQAQQAIQQHIQETQQHIQRLEQCFQILGSKVQRETCAGVQGLKTEHDAFLQENPSPDILTMFDLGAAAKTEHYEIASYTGLIEKSKLMGQQQVADLLQQNLQQEQAMLQRVTQAGQRLGQQMIGQANTGQMGQSSQTTTTP